MSGDFFYSKLLTRWSATGVGTNAGVTVTHTGVVLQVSSCSGIQVSGDVAALVTIESPLNTVLWRKRFTDVFSFSESFPPGSVRGPIGSSLIVKVSASTSNCEANIQGFDQIGG